MKQKLLNIKHKLIALWWFLTKKNYYLLSYPTNHEIIMELKNIGNLCRSTDILAYNEIKALIEKLEK